MARPGLEPEVLRTVGVSGGPCPGALSPRCGHPWGGTWSVLHCRGLGGTCRLPGEDQEPWGLMRGLSRPHEGAGSLAFLLGLARPPLGRSGHRQHHPSDSQHRQVPGSCKAEVAPPERRLGSLTRVLLGAPAALKERPSFSGRSASAPAFLLTHRALHPLARGPHPSHFPCTALLGDSSRQPSSMPPALAHSCLSLESRRRPSSLGTFMGS